MEFSWGSLVQMLQLGIDSVFASTLRLLELFTTPFGQIIENDVGASEWFTNLVSWVFDFFGVNFMQITPLQLMLGSAIPLIIVFTVYRYIKQ